MRAPFEKELKNKLLIKTVGNQSEEMVLLRAFKYFDLSNTNLCDKENFVKTVMKIGITGFTEKNISSIFEIYDTEKTGKINYKDFIGILYHNPSIMDNPEKLQINKRTKDYQTVDYASFLKTASDFKFGLNEESIQNLFFFFDKEEKGRIDYDEFIRVIRGQMSNNRRELIEKIFETFEPDKEGIVHINKISENFNPENHPDVIKGLQKPEDIYNEFIETFEGNHNYLNGDEAHFGNVDLDEFIDYYDSVSMMIDSDKEFENIVKSAWLGEAQNEEEDNEQQSQNEDKKLRSKKIIKRVKNDEEKEENKIQIDNENEEEDNKNKEKELNDALESFKNYLKDKGAMTVLTLARQFKIIDENGNKVIDLNEFSKGIKNAGLEVPQEVLEELFASFDYDGSGAISYDEFMVKILGEMNERRIAVVKAAFNKIDLDKSGVVELSEIKRWYNTKNNPQVISGEITEEDLYSRFVETFGNHHNLYSGIRDKRVTWKEFLDYYKYISFVVEDDDLFEGILVAAWKLENTSEYINTQRKEDIKKIKMLEQNLEEKQESIRGRKNLTSNGMAPFGVDKEPVDYGTSNDKLRSKKKEEDKKQYQNQIQTQYQKFSYQAEGESALNILKDTILQRGTRGILGMRRSFMIDDDEDNNHILTFENFYKYITNFLIPLSRNQSASLFKLFDKKNSGEIIYDNLINEIVENLSDERKYYVNCVFDKLEAGCGTVNLNVIRNKFNPAGHPDVVIGRKTEQEILAEFLDNIDYHFNLLNQGKNNEDDEITNQEFLEFYRYISAGIDNDGDFRKIINGVWGLEKPKRFSEKRYY